MGLGAFFALHCGAAPALAATAPAMGLVPAGEPAPLIDQAQRASLGLRNGPDSIVDLWQVGGQPYLLFSGAALVDGRMAGGATFRLGVDKSLQTVAGPLQVLMRADCRDRRTDAPGTCQNFDSDYAGAGTVFTCPNGRTLYVYHGENHTVPDGHRAKNPNAGWTGIGIATWDDAQKMFAKQGQIAGLNASNSWFYAEDGAGTQQSPAASGNPSIVPDPTGAFLYLYFADRAAAQEDDAEPGQRCDRRTCWAVARAPLAKVCADPRTPWHLWHAGSFTQPALLAGGTGGAFTPLLRLQGGQADTLANVTRLPGQHAYVMASVQRPSGAILGRISMDGLAWSEPAQLVGPPAPGTAQSYARVVAEPGNPKNLVLLYVVHEGKGWGNASLLRLKLRVVPK